AVAPLDLADKSPANFPEFRGNRQRNGVVTGPKLVRDWEATPPRRLWRQPVGAGHAGFAVSGNAAITIEQRRGKEAVVCYDTTTGRERWVFAYDALFSEQMGGKGPRATPTIADGEVFSMGALGKLFCLDAVTGSPKWSVDTLSNNANLKWAMSGSPLVLDSGLVVVSPGVQTEGAPAGTLMAFDRKKGELAWKAGTNRTGYSSPMLAALGGLPQIVLLDGDGVAGYAASTGKELWRHAWETQEGINVAQPVVTGPNHLFISSGYGVGCALLHIKEADGKWSVEEAWKNSNLRCKFTSAVLRDGHLYGLDEGVLTCLKVKTGKRAWRSGSYGHGQVLLSDDLLLITSEE